MNKNKLKILKYTKNPITIKALKEKTGLKWANLSKHIKELKKQGFIVQVGKYGKSKVIQINKYLVLKHLTNEIKIFTTIKKELK